MPTEIDLTPPCAHCGGLNPVDAGECEECGENPNARRIECPTCGGAGEVYVSQDVRTVFGPRVSPCDDEACTCPDCEGARTVETDYYQDRQATARSYDRRAA